ncbi:MAG: hypothetical protein KC444_07900 [Nitrosopumilus sp.]|nr:hypothetical protein [Nitrosopumilus sp.]
MIPVVVFPSILSLSGIGGDDDLTNIIFQASFDGRLKSSEGLLTAAGDLCTLTAAAGKDLYLSAAKVVFFMESGGSGFSNEAVLKVNGTIVETAKASFTAIDGGSFAGDMNLVYEFKNIGHKVTAAQILKIEAILVDPQVAVEGFIQAVEVPAGQNPTTYTGS